MQLSFSCPESNLILSNVICIYAIPNVLSLYKNWVQEPVFKISQVLIVLFQKKNNVNNLVKAIKVV